MALPCAAFIGLCRRGLRLLGAVCLLGVALSAQALTLWTTDTASGDGAKFPADAATQRVVLPDVRSQAAGGGEGARWYRARFEGHQLRADLPALFIERVCADFDVRINGHLLYQSAPLPVARPCSHPYLLTLPAALLVDGENVLDIKVSGPLLERVASRQRAAGLSGLHIDDRAALAGEHARRLWFNVTLPQMLSGTLILLGGFMVVLGSLNRRHSHLAYFGALAMGLALLTAPLLWRAAFLPHAAVEWLHVALAPWLVMAGVQFLVRLAGWRSRPLTLLLMAQVAAVPLSLAIAGVDHLHLVSSLWQALFAVQLLAALVFCLRSLKAQHHPMFWPLLGLALLAVAGAGFELMADVARLAQPRIAAAQSAPLMALVALGLLLTLQYGQALRQSEASRETLETRVREATAEIERNFDQLAQARVEQVTATERKRIAGDLHDDLGAKLLTIVHTSADPAISTLAREALDEMRLSVRGLTGRPMLLADAVGDWRVEVISRLAQAQVSAEWHAPDDLPQTLSARAYVQTTRILREAVNNIIRHSGATHCTVSIRIADGDFLLCIEDNGHGITAEAEDRLGRGHGLTSMKQRAKQLRGQCLVESTVGVGTAVRLSLPMQPHTEPAG